MITKWGKKLNKFNIPITCSFNSLLWSDKFGPIEADKSIKNAEQAYFRAFYPKYGLYEPADKMNKMLSRRAK